MKPNLAAVLALASVLSAGCANPPTLVPVGTTSVEIPCPEQQSGFVCQLTQMRPCTMARPGGQVEISGVIDVVTRHADISNAAYPVPTLVWLKADLRDHGWYKVSIYGADADKAAWLIVQHARHDLAFQEKVLGMLEPLWQSGETAGENFANLYDQTAHYKGRPGRFGVVGDCTAPGVWTPVPQEDRDAIDAWRAKAGMPPFAQYVAARARGCTD